MPRARALPPGIRRLSNRHLQAYIKVNGRFRSKCFAPDTSLGELHRWRDLQRVASWVPEAEAVADGPALGDDIARYLKAVAGMPSFRHRQDDLELWRATFGRGRPRATITAVDIRQQLEAWRADGYAASTLNHRRTALMSLWTVLDGPEAPNPARQVPRYRAETAPLVLPTVRQATRAVRAVRRGSATRARLELMLWTGWPHMQIERLTEAQVRDAIQRKQITLVGRRKGGGTREATLPLLPQAVAALRGFHRADAYGAFSRDSMRKSLHLACDALKISRFHPYTLRHLFLNVVALATKDDRVVATLGQHTDLRQTRRYTESSVDPRLAEGMVLVAAATRRAR